MDESPFTGGDAEVVAMLRKHEFRGPIWERYVEYLARYAVDTLSASITGKRIFREMRRKRIPCHGPVVIGRSDAEDLARMAVAHAVEPHRRALMDDGWDPHGPASLRTAFWTECLLQFPNLYRSWLREKLGNDGEKIDLLPGDEQVADRADERARDDAIQALLFGDPESTAILREEQRALLALLPDELRAVIQLVVQGFSFAEAARAQGQDPERLRRRLYTIRPRLRLLWDERAEEPDP